MKLAIVNTEELQRLIEDAVRKVIPPVRESASQLSKLLGVKEAADYLKIAPQTLYTYTSNRLIPFIKKGKFIYFRREHLDEWLDSGTKRSVNQI